MDARLHRLLVKVRENNGGLEPDDLAYLGQLLDGPTADDDAPRPLWWFLRRQAALWRGVFQLDAHRWIGGLEHILTDCGAPRRAGAKPSVHLTQPVRRSDLHAAVRQNLTSPETDRRSAAAALVGFAELHDLAPTLVDMLASGRESRANNGQPIVAACLESLARLRHPRTAELALTQHAPDYTIRQVLAPVLLSCADQLSDAELGAILNSEFSHDLLNPYGAVVARAVRAGVVHPDKVRTIVTENVWDASRCLLGAQIVVGADLDAMYAELLGTSGSLPTALALAALAPAGGEISPAQARRAEILRGSLDALDGTARSAAIVAIASHSADPLGTLAAHATGDTHALLGVVWGCLGRSELPPALEEVLTNNASASHESTLRRAAQFVLAHRESPVHPQVATQQWLQLLLERDWWPWQIAVDACRAARIAAPPVVDLFHALNASPCGDTAELDRRIAAFAEAPWALVAWLDPKRCSHDQIQSTLLYAALVGGEAQRSVVESTLLAATEDWIQEHHLLALAALGGPATAVAEVRVRLLQADYNEDPRLPPEAQSAAVATALFCTQQLRTNAVRSLASFGGAVEEELLLLLGVDDTNVADAAARAVAKLRAPRHPLLADVARLLGGEASTASALVTADQLVHARSPLVRRSLVELAGRPGNALDDVAPLLLQAMADEDVEVGSAALLAWASLSPASPWLRSAVVALSRRTDAWMAPERAMGIMAQLADPVFLPHLGRHLLEDPQSGRLDAALAALDRMGTVRPEIGVVTLDAREPWRVRERFALPHDEVRHEAEAHGEALRLLMLGLARRARPSEVATRRGQRVLLTPLVGELPAGSRIPSDVVEGLLMHLTVVFADEESGAILAEVVTDPSGEVLTALLQSRPVAAAVASWT